MTDEIQGAPGTQQHDSAKTGWSSIQVYTLSAICLLIGVTMGYLFRGSSTPKASAAAPTVQQQAMPQQTMQQQPGEQQGAAAPNQKQPSKEDMQRMAEKQVAPLLDQLKQNPKDVPTLAKIGYYYAISGLYDQAAIYYGKAAELKPSVEAYTSAGTAEAYEGHTDKAMAYLEKALKLDPNSADALFNLGMLKWQAKHDTKGALECWEKLVKANPNHPRINDVKQLIAHVKQQGPPPKGDAQPAAQ